MLWSKIILIIETIHLFFIITNINEIYSKEIEELQLKIKRKMIQLSQK